MGLMSSILTGKDSKIIDLVEQAKNFIKSSKYERLTDREISNLKRDEMIIFLDSLKRVIKALHRAAINKGNVKDEARLLNARRLITESEAALEANVSAKLVYIHLIQNLDI